MKWYSNLHVFVFRAHVHPYAGKSNQESIFDIRVRVDVRAETDRPDWQGRLRVSTEDSQGHRHHGARPRRRRGGDGQRQHRIAQQGAPGASRAGAHKMYCKTYRR